MSALANRLRQTTFRERYLHRAGPRFHMSKSIKTGWMLAGMLGIAVTIMSCSWAAAQSALGGARLQQNKIGGVAKPAPVVGGANTHATITPKPPSPMIVGRPASPMPGAVGGIVPAGQASAAQAAGNARVNSPVMTPNKSGAALAGSSKSPKP